MTGLRTPPPAGTKPSVDLHRYIRELRAGANALDHQSDKYGTPDDHAVARLYRLVAHDLDLIANRCDTYETDVNGLIDAVTDVEHPMFGDPDESAQQLRKALGVLAEKWTVHQ